MMEAMYRDKKPLIDPEKQWTVPGTVLGYSVDLTPTIINDLLPTDGQRLFVVHIICKVSHFSH